MPRAWLLYWLERLLFPLPRYDLSSFASRKMACASTFLSLSGTKSSRKADIWIRCLDDRSGGCSRTQLPPCSVLVGACWNDPVGVGASLSQRRSVGARLLCGTQRFKSGIWYVGGKTIGHFVKSPRWVIILRGLSAYMYIARADVFVLVLSRIVCSNMHIYCMSANYYFLFYIYTRFI